MNTRRRVLLVLLVLVVQFMCGCGLLRGLVEGTRVKSDSEVSHIDKTLFPTRTEERTVRIWSIPEEMLRDTYGDELTEFVVDQFADLVEGGIKLLFEKVVVINTVGGEKSMEEFARTSTEAGGTGDVAKEALNIASGGGVSLPSGATAEAPGVTTETEGRTTSSMRILYVIGGLAVLAGVAIAGITKRLKTGIVIASGGGILIVAARVFEQYPWVPLVLMGLGVVGAIVAVLYARKGDQRDTTLAAVITGVHNSEDKGKATRDLIEKAAGGNDKIVRKVVGSIKERENLK